MTDTVKEKPLILALCGCLGISPSRIRKDECGDYEVPCKGGKIYTVGEWWYVYSDNSRLWGVVKKKLNFMEVHQDGDDEGIMRADFPPSDKQAEVIRRMFKIRKSYIPTFGKKND